MAKDLNENLSPAFVDNVTSLCGERGKDWLERLPQTIAALEKQWSISVTKPFQNLSYNYVANVELPDGKSAVLKIGLPLNDVEIYGEVRYLQLLDGCGAVKVLSFDREKEAILLERVAPGANLKSVCKRDQSQAVKIAVDVLKRILRPVPEETADLISLDDWFDGLKRAEGTKFPQDYARKALDIYSDLSRDTAKIHLLHGDLHHENILSAKREPFLVIDPKGIIGHVGYDIGVFLNNHHDWLDWDTRLESRLDSAISEFAAAFDVGELVIRKWAFCQMVLSWWWMFDEMPDLFGEELGLSHVWGI